MDSVYMTIPELMDYLHISRKTAYRLTTGTGTIPVYCLSQRKNLVKRMDVDKYLQRHKR